MPDCDGLRLDEKGWFENLENSIMPAERKPMCAWSKVASWAAKDKTSD